MWLQYIQYILKDTRINQTLWWLNKACVFTLYTPNSHCLTITTLSTTATLQECHTFSSKTRFVFLSCLFPFLAPAIKTTPLFFPDASLAALCEKFIKWYIPRTGTGVSCLVSSPWFHTSEIHVTSLALKCKEVPMAYFPVTKYIFFYCLCLLFFFSAPAWTFFLFVALEHSPCYKVIRGGCCEVCTSWQISRSWL